MMILISLRTVARISTHATLLLTTELSVFFVYYKLIWVLVTSNLGVKPTVTLDKE